MEHEKKEAAQRRSLSMLVAALALLSLFQIPPKTTLAVVQPPAIRETVPEQIMDYVLNRNTKIFHLPDCKYVSQILEKNRRSFTGTRSEVYAMGYDACSQCRP